MAEEIANARIVLTTAGSPQQAERLGRALVEEQLAACVTVIPLVQSFYRWQGKIEADQESMLLIKTNCAQLEALEARLHQLHSYQTPEFLVLTPEAGSRAYLGWLESCVRRD